MRPATKVGAGRIVMAVRPVGVMEVMKISTGNTGRTGSEEEQRVHTEGTEHTELRDGAPIAIITCITVITVITKGTTALLSPVGSTSVEQSPEQTRPPSAGERRDQPKCLGGTVGSVICIHAAGRRNIWSLVLARHLNAPRPGNLNADGSYQWRRLR